MMVKFDNDNDGEDIVLIVMKKKERSYILSLILMKYKGDELQVKKMIP